MLEAGLMQGWSNQRVADALGVGVSTLKRNFGPLLRMRDQMPDRLRLLIFSTAVRKSIEGDMGAIRQVRQLIDDNERRLAAARVNRAAEKDKADEQIGKKERARRDAKEVAKTGGGDLWGGDLSPGEYH
ncbi:hypothetical protein [Salipiger bermudensis]|uniref:hypothetical protein n=1 Tax=Salipiger bermudensis TaxID=344736 RepID=UPI001A8D1BD2|nr:hypothetical protein [Salipiger bermudensis]MBN9674633.1 hypothetical protein [Salipiger bermudensis]